MTAGSPPPSRLPIFGRSGLTRRSTSSESSPIRSIALHVQLVRDEIEQLLAHLDASIRDARSRRAPAAAGPGSRPASGASGRARRRAARRPSTARAPRRGGPPSPAPASASGGRCRRAGPRARPTTMRFWYSASAMNGRMGAIDRASVTSAAWSVANAPFRSAGSAPARIRSRDRRRYHVERSSMNVRISRVAASAS